MQVRLPCFFSSPARPCWELKRRQLSFVSDPARFCHCFAGDVERTGPAGQERRPRRRPKAKSAGALHGPLIRTLTLTLTLTLMDFRSSLSVSSSAR